MKGPLETSVTDSAQPMLYYGLPLINVLSWEFACAPYAYPPSAEFNATVPAIVECRVSDTVTH